MNGLENMMSGIEKMSIKSRGRSVVIMNKKRKMLTEQLEDRRLLAGPYAPAAGQLGSTAIAHDDSAIIGWATGYENYQPGSDVDLAFQVPENAIGQAEGTISDAVTLGRSGQITLSFSTPIRNGFGSDFAIFENSFSDTFLELAYVEVSSDGLNFFRFENDSLTPSPVAAFGEVDPTNVHNLAGKYRRGQGTPFDLDDLHGISPLLQTAAVTHVRVVDVVGDGTALDTSGDVIYDPSPTVGSAGFDLDGVGVLNAFEYSSDVIDFEDVGSELEPQSFFNGPDPNGTIVTGPYDDVVVLGNFQSELLTFNNAYSTDFDSWNQWAYANMTDTTTAGYLNQFSAYPGNGAHGSATFGVGFASQGNFYDAPLITRPAGDLRSFGSLSVTNTTYAALSMLLGDSFAKKFGGDSGNDPDFFKLSIEGLDASGQAVGQVDVFLADYQFANNSLDYILDDWVTVDLAPVSNARSLSFSLTSSDVGGFGMNTPSYFAVDDIVMLTPTVAFDLEKDSVLESDGANATMARVSRAGGDSSEAIEFTLEPVDASQAVLPASVTIPAGANHVDFPIGVVDNSDADGDREVTIRVSADGYTATEKSLQIRDDDPFRVSLDLSAVEIAEGGVVNGTLVRNDAVPDNPLTIQLSASIDGRLSFASTVVMAAGQKTASFDIAAPEDDVDHRDVTVQITAQASGYEDGTSTLFVLDNDTPKLDFTFSNASFSEQGAKPTEGFELLGRRLAPESAYNGSDNAGQFDTGGLVFNNEYNPTYGSWSGWAYSNTTDVTTSGYLNQYSSFSGGGAVNSGTYLVGNAYPGFVVPRITRDPASTGPFSSLDITNTTYAALSMYEGDLFGAKKFGGASGNDPDSFALTIEGLDANDVSIGTVEFLLADFTFDDQDSDYILDSWTSVDLSSIGDATALTFSLLSSDIGTYGMNTPAYFALDNVKFEGSEEQPVLTVTRNALDQTEDLLVQLYTSDHSEAVVQPTVLVPAGESAVDVPWEIIDDSVSDNTRPVTFTALAEGYTFAQHTILIEDNDAAVLTLSLSADSVDEDSGSLVGLVHRNSGDLSFPLVVSLDSDLSGQLDFPSSVTIPAGQRSQTFDVDVVDNAVVDDDRVVELVATKVGYETGSASVLILDEDVEVTLSLSREVVSELDSRVTVHAEDLGSRIASDSADNGSNGSGGFTSGPVFLNNDFNSTYGSWSGWSVSNSTDVTTPGYLNQYSAISGGGALESSTYFVASAYGYPALPTITVSEGFDFDSLLVTNTTYAALSMQEGDAFAKKFGGETGNDSDYFLLTIEGFDSSSASVGTVDFYLADYRFADNSQDYLLSDWSVVDVSSLGSASSLVFSLSSSDVGVYGMNTPAYFAIDQLVLSDSRPAPAVLTVSRSDEELSSALVVELSVDKTEVHLPSEVLIPAGSSSLEVPVYSVADGTDDDDQAVSIVAAAEGHVGAMSTLTVEDNDAAVLTLSLSADSVDEDSGSLVGLVHRNSGDLSFPLVVSLDSDLSGQLDFPSSVTIPAGQRSQTFDVNVVDNEYRDGDRVVQLVSAVENYSASGVSIEIVDDEVSAILLFPTDGGTVFSEELGTDGFGVTLASRPQSDVLIILNLTDGDVGPSDMTINTSQVLFTPDNWNVPHMVSLTGIPDLLVEGDEVGSVTLRVDVANSDSMYSAASDALLGVVILEWQPSTLRISEDATSIFLADNSSGIRLATGTHASGLNVLGNEFPQFILIEPLAETTGVVQVDLGAGADVVELNGGDLVRLEGGAGIDRFVVNAATTFELLEYINGRVSGFEEYVLKPQEAASIEVDLNRLGEFAAGGEAVVLDLYLETAEQFKVLGERSYGSPEMVGGQFAQVIVSDGGRLRVISERPWQNVVQPGDANHDEKVTPLDALVILNHLGVHGSALAEAPTLADFLGVYLDVSGDGRATPWDSLLVLNQIASADNPEGESSELPLARDLLKLLGEAYWQAIQADGLLSIRDPSLTKVASILHPADQAIRDLYSSPDATVEMTNDDESELLGDFLGSKSSV
ncbi:DUF4465 domain-containing protein [bacterium]|nr:DUF4465 domain-containing protein [bacterium]